MDQLNTNPLFKKVTIGLLSILIIFVAVKTIHEISAISHIGKIDQVPNSINVSGKGEITTTPDIATFSFTVTEQAPAVSDAQSKATAKMNAILAYIKKSDVKDTDVKTLSYNISPRYEYQNTTYSLQSKQILVGYEVSQTIELKVRKLADAGLLLTGIGEFGATNVSGLSFSVDKQEDLARQARDKAILNAQTEAKKLADALGVKLGSITSFYESAPYQPYPIYYAKDMMMASVSSERITSPQIPTGENKITSNVTITYEIK